MNRANAPSTSRDRNPFERPQRPEPSSESSSGQTPFQPARKTATTRDDHVPRAPMKSTAVQPSRPRPPKLKVSSRDAPCRILIAYKASCDTAHDCSAQRFAAAAIRSQTASSPQERRATDDQGHEELLVRLTELQSLSRYLASQKPRYCSEHVASHAGRVFDPTPGCRSS